VAGSGTGSGIGLLSFIIKKTKSRLFSQPTTHGWVRAHGYTRAREMVGSPSTAKHTHLAPTHRSTKLKQECSGTC